MTSARSRAATEPPDVRTFLETYPLYTKLRIAAATMEPADLRPLVLELRCQHCQRSRPFRIPGTGFSRLARAELHAPRPNLVSELRQIVYICSDCGRSMYTFYIQVNVEESWVRKVGQVPPWSIAVDPELKRNLGEGAEHYKLARVCLSQGYGLGACAYLRRVLEDCINNVLRLELAAKQAEQAPQVELREIGDALEAKDLLTKTEVAYRLAPSSIIVEGNNPLKLIHEQLSGGVHRGSEDECSETALRLANALAYVVTELSRREERRNEYAKAIRKAAAAPQARPGE